MANITSIKIPELSELSREEFTGAEYLVLDTGTATKKMQVSDFNRASTETATAKANAAAQSATDAAESALNAQNAAQSATDAIANARAQITQDVIDARNAKSNAESYANTARNLVNSDYALTARSYATGDAEDALGHEYREGQSTDNAKYYAEQCEAHDSAAATSETNAKASENNAKASEIAAANSAEIAADSARQALENATGATVFVGTDGNSAHPTASGLVPAPSAHDGPNAILTSSGGWKEIQNLGIATTDNLNTLKTQLQTSFQDGVDTIYDAITAQGVTPSASTPSACATGISTVATNKYNAGKAEGKTEAEAVTWETAEMSLFNGYVSLDSGASGQISSHPVHVSASAIYDLTNVISFTITDIRGNAPCYYKIHYANGSASQNTKLSAGQTYTISSGKTIEFFNTGTTGVRSILVFGKFRYQAKILR